MSKINKTIKHALDRFLANIGAGNDAQITLFMKRSEKYASNSNCTFFTWFSSKNENPAIEIIELAKRSSTAKNKIHVALDHTLLSRALEDYLDTASRKAKYNFVTQILEHYDLEARELKTGVIKIAVNYLRRQNFIRELQAKGYERNIFGMKGVSF